jgi:hypothetical protein
MGQGDLYGLLVLNSYGRKTASIIDEVASPES